MSPSETRMKIELKEVCKDDQTSGVSASMVGDDMRHLKGRIQGPSGTPYEGGVFEIDIQLPHQYPFVPPKMNFVTKVWHPNISSQTGAICLDILKDQWSPALTIKTALLSLQALLSAPEPDDPQDAQVAAMYKNDHDTYTQTARFWTESYARTHDQEEAIRRVCDMGFDADRARQALERCQWNESEAVNSLLSG